MMDRDTYHGNVILPSVLFFSSGFAALVYQLVWMRRLALFFGSDIYSAAITTSGFMGGLCLGAFAAERLVDRFRQHLVIYGAFEILIACYALFFSDILHVWHPLLKELYLHTFESEPLLYHTARAGVAAFVLLLPTTLMGATLPLIVRCFSRTAAATGRVGGLFYAVNTFGGLSGVLAASFLLIPRFGMPAAERVAAAVNFAVGATAVLFSGRMTPKEAQLDRGPSAGTITQVAYDAGTARTALVAIALSGAAALALEVVWMRILTLSFSATVHSFSIMLACFLLGIFLGSRNASRTIDGRPDPVAYFGRLETAIGLLVALSGILVYVAPVMFGSLVWTFTSISGGKFGIADGIAEALVSGILIIVPAWLLGATFPAAVRICTPDPERAGFGTGRVAAANTAGAVIGATSAGFVLIPSFGSRSSMLVIAAVFLSTGLMLLRRSEPQRFFASRPFLGAVGLFVLFAGTTVLLPRQTVLNFNMQKNSRPDLLYHGEGVAHSVDIVRGGSNTLIMMVDGAVEADTSPVQRRHFILKGNLPLLLHPAPSSSAVVGLGLGITLAAMERNPETKNIQVIELNPEMVAAHEFLENATGGVLKDPKLSVRVDDGRNYFTMEERRFDVITADPIHPRISGVGYLYTEEYYRAIAGRLNPGGVVCQWMPMYGISRRSFDVAFRTFFRVFENASFWYVRGHGLFIATRDPFSIDFRQLTRRLHARAVSEDMSSIGINSPELLVAHLLMGPAQIKRYLASSGETTLNTDANAWLEYHTPSEFLMGTRDIVSALLPFAGFDPDLVVNITKQERGKVMTEWNKRRDRILQELDKPLS